MLDEFVSEELQKDYEVAEIPQDKIERVIQALLRLRKKYDDEIHKEELKVYEELAESLFELRVEKVIEGVEAKGFDKEALSIISKIKQFYVGYLTGRYYTSKGRVLCKVNKKVIIDDVQLSPGDVVILPLSKVLALITSDYITPIEVG